MQANNLVSEAPEEVMRRARFTLMADYMGAYGWWNPGGDHTVGACVGTADGWAGDEPISDALHAACLAWQRRFEAARLVGPDCRPAIDLKGFHAEGIALARLFREELPATVSVWYVRPPGDPEYRGPERIMVLPGGELAHWKVLPPAGRAASHGPAVDGL